MSGRTDSYWLFDTFLDRFETTKNLWSLHWRSAVTMAHSICSLSDAKAGEARGAWEARTRSSQRHERKTPPRNWALRRPDPSDTQAHSHSQVQRLVVDRRSGLIALTTALLTTTVADAPATAAGARTGGLDFKPRDLEFPPFFEGVWKVTSVLTKIDVPYGEAAVPDIRVVRRAQSEDLNRRVSYSIKFIRGSKQSGDSADFVVMDRKFNTAALISEYMPGMSIDRAMERIQWAPVSPDRMVVNLPGGLTVTTDVTRRSQERTADDALTTNEFTQQFFDSSNGVKLKASRAYTKWRWRDSGDGKQIAASQIIADYRDPADPGTLSAGVPLQSVGQPVVLMTYRMTLVPFY